MLRRELLVNRFGSSAESDRTLMGVYRGSISNCHVYAIFLTCGTCLLQTLLLDNEFGPLKNLNLAW